MSYGNPLTLSGNGGVNSFDCTSPARRNLAINAIRTWALLHGWTNPLVGGDHDGTPAFSDMTTIAVPAHSGAPGGFSQVPLNSTGMGGFDGYWFYFWDPYSTLGGPHGHGDEDPSGHAGPFGTIVVGVPLGLNDPDATVSNFASALAANTRYTFTVTAFQNPITALGAGTLTAKGNGPDYHDPFWAPDSSSIAGPSPLGGGWYLYSTPAPNTGDQIKLWVVRPFGGDGSGELTLQAIPDGITTGQVGLRNDVHNAVISPYHIMFQQRAGGPTITGSKAYMAVCLAIPPEIQPTSFNVTAITNVNAQDIVLTTDVPHGLKLDGRCWISGVIGPTVNVNGTWWVAAVPSPSSLKISAKSVVSGAGSILQGNGVGSYTGTGGILKRGVFQSVLVTDGLTDQPIINSGAITVIVNGSIKTSWTTTTPPSGHRTVTPVLLQTINIGTEHQDGLSSIGVKPIFQPVYVAMTFEDDAPARIAGTIWDTTLELKNRDYGDQNYINGDKFMTWMVHGSSPLNSAMWVRAVED